MRSFDPRLGLRYCGVHFAFEVIERSAKVRHLTPHPSRVRLTLARRKLGVEAIPAPALGFPHGGQELSRLLDCLPLGEAKAGAHVSRVGHRSMLLYGLPHRAACGRAMNRVNKFCHGRSLLKS